MQFVIKLVLSVCIILVCAYIGRHWPSLSGLIATMPLTSLVVLLWLYSDLKGASNGDISIIERYTLGAALGIIPSFMFFVTAYLCAKNRIPFFLVLVFSFIVWLVGAIVHQKFIGYKYSIHVSEVNKETYK